MERCVDDSGGRFPSATNDGAVSRDATPLRDANARGDAADSENETATRPLTLNHALVNVYERTDGIMAHEDGPLYRDCAAIYRRRVSRDNVAQRRAADDTDARAATTTAPESSSSSSFGVFLPPIALGVHGRGVSSVRTASRETSTST